MTQCWDDFILVHPAAKMFPPMSDDDLVRLGEDIKQNGLQHPVVLLKPKDGDAVLLDGRSRLDAMERVGMGVVGDDGRLAIETETIEDHDGFDPLAYVTSANLHRRHLTAEQSREIIAKVLEADPSKSDRAIGKMVRRDHKTVAAVRREKEVRGEIPHTETRTDTKGRQQSTMRRRDDPPREVPDAPQSAPAGEGEPQGSAKVEGEPRLDAVEEKSGETPPLEAAKAEDAQALMRMVSASLQRDPAGALRTITMCLGGPRLETIRKIPREVRVEIARDILAFLRVNPATLKSA